VNAELASGRKFVYWVLHSELM